MDHSATPEEEETQSAVNHGGAFYSDEFKSAISAFLLKTALSSAADFNDRVWEHNEGDRLTLTKLFCRRIRGF